MSILVWILGGFSWTSFDMYANAGLGTSTWDYLIHPVLLYAYSSSGTSDYHILPALIYACSSLDTGDTIDYGLMEELWMVSELHRELNIGDSLKAPECLKFETLSFNMSGSNWDRDMGQKLTERSWADSTHNLCIFCACAIDISQ